MSLGQMFMNFLDQAKGLDSKTARLQRQEKKEAADEERRKKERVTVGMVFSFTITRMRKSGKENIKHYTATVLDVDKDLEGDPTAFPHLIQYVRGRFPSFSSLIGRCVGLYMLVRVFLRCAGMFTTMGTL